jgi:hypothetical protein
MVACNGVFYKKTQFMLSIHKRATVTLSCLQWLFIFELSCLQWLFIFEFKQLIQPLEIRFKDEIKFCLLQTSCCFISTSLSSTLNIVPVAWPRSLETRNVFFLSFPSFSSFEFCFIIFLFHQLHWYAHTVSHPLFRKKRKKLPIFV